ncbi:TRAP transporter small permease [Effusibacillus dendaii]|uniref:TRAP transporter permease n=1 Tax=Effusibacillus dendaii TaxID=2743772 RepID=A0A7I8D9H0_9BACL|nr:TRAP transporter small permease [Effusibacillus dendaii]BCJ86764.1 TRAP transporter permease [Effusibacillus dendaii]
MKKGQRGYRLFEDLSSGLFLVTGFLLMFYEVVMRYVFNSPTTWVNEISTMFVVWGVLLGLSLGLRDNHHISVDILYEFLPGKVRRLIDFIANLAGLVFCLFFTYNGIILVGRGIKSSQVSIETGIPIWVYYLVVPISGVMFGIRFLTKIYELRHAPSVEAGKEAETIEHYHAF